jgi:protein TonB
LVDPSRSSTWRIVIEPEHRELFGSRIEDRYDQRFVCVSPVTAAARSDVVLVSDPQQIAIKDVPASSPLPGDVARTCDPGVRLPSVIRDVKPMYTPDAMRAKVRGSVFLHGVVDETGVVRDIRVVHSLEPGLDDAARKAFAHWEFRPATRGGEPVAIAISVQMAFTLADPR